MIARAVLSLVDSQPLLPISWQQRLFHVLVRILLPTALILVNVNGQCFAQHSDPIKRLATVVSEPIPVDIGNNLFGECKFSPAHFAADVHVPLEISKTSLLELRARSGYSWGVVADFAGFIDLAKVHGKLERSAAYVAEVFQVEGDTSVVLSLGSDDDLDVWINGQYRYGACGARATIRHNDLVRAVLRPGNNTVLYRITQRTGNWSLYREVLPGDQMDDLLRSNAHLLFNDLPVAAILENDARLVELKPIRVSAGEVEVRMTWCQLAGDHCDLYSEYPILFPRALELPPWWSGMALLRIEVIGGPDGRQLYMEEVPILSQSRAAEIATLSGDQQINHPVWHARAQAINRIVLKAGEGEYSTRMKASALADWWRLQAMPRRWHTVPGPQNWGYASASDGNVQPFRIFVPPNRGKKIPVSVVWRFGETLDAQVDFWSERGRSHRDMSTYASISQSLGAAIVTPFGEGRYDFGGAGSTELADIQAALSTYFELDPSRFGLIVRSGLAPVALDLLATAPSPITHLYLAGPSLGHDVKRISHLVKRIKNTHPDLQWTVRIGENDEVVDSEGVVSFVALLKSLEFIVDFEQVPFADHDLALMLPEAEFLYALSNGAGEPQLLNGSWMNIPTHVDAAVQWELPGSARWSIHAVVGMLLGTILIVAFKRLQNATSSALTFGTLVLVVMAHWQLAGTWKAGPLVAAFYAAGSYASLVYFARVSQNWPIRIRTAWLILGWSTFAGIVTLIELWVLSTEGHIELIFGMACVLAEVMLMLLSLAHVFELCDVLPAEEPNVGQRSAARVEGPFVSVHVPCHNEPPGLVIETLRSLSEMRYRRFEVIVIDNNTRDEHIWRPIQEWCAVKQDTFRFFHVDELEGFKAGALNYALANTAVDADLIAVVDSDYVVEPEFLSDMVTYFEDEHVGFVQSPQHYREIDALGSYGRALYASYKGFFDVSMRSRAKRNALIFAGTMGLIRKSDLQRVGGWAEWCVTEDAEMSLRLLAKGVEGRYVSRPYGKGLMPLTHVDVCKQRHRWALGSFQLLRRHWRLLVPFRGTGLSGPQKYAYLNGCFQWLNDPLAFVFAIIFVVGVGCTLLDVQLKVMPLAKEAALIPVVLLISSAIRYIVGLMRLSGVRLRDALGAVAISLSLIPSTTWAICGGVLGVRAEFSRTPKERVSGVDISRRVTNKWAQVTVEGSIAFVATLLVTQVVVHSAHFGDLFLSVATFSVWIAVTALSVALARSWSNT